MKKVSFASYPTEVIHFSRIETRGCLGVQTKSNVKYFAAQIGFGKYQLFILDNGAGANRLDDNTVYDGIKDIIEKTKCYGYEYFIFDSAKELFQWLVE